MAREVPVECVGKHAEEWDTVWPRPDLDRQPPVSPQHSAKFLNPAPSIGKEHEIKLADHHIDTLVSARQLLAIHHNRNRSESGDSSLGYSQHGQREVGRDDTSRDADLRGCHGRQCSRASSSLKDLLSDSHPCCRQQTRAERGGPAPGELIIRPNPGVVRLALHRHSLSRLLENSAREQRAGELPEKSCIPLQRLSSHSIVIL